MKKIIASIAYINSTPIKKIGGIIIKKHNWEFSLFGTQKTKAIKADSIYEVELDKKIVNTNDAAQITGYSVSHLNSLARKGKVSSINMGVGKRAERYFLLPNLFEYAKKHNKNV